MKFSDLIRKILADYSDGLTPQEIREIIKVNYPAYYGTETHKRNVDKKHYKNLDHALLAQIYTVSRSISNVYADKTQKPVKLSILSSPADQMDGNGALPEDLNKLEKGVGTLYVLGTHLYDKNGEEIIKIGITTGSVDARISQLYTTGVPYRFRIIKEFETKNYAELENSLHKLLDPFRINKSREFFVEKALEYIDKVLKIHNEILNDA
ncbi:MAG: hypothetical protein COB38_10105 [Gammaproteobacteria bacterium]|nr:MAG: hypothetical protein COB38_10105 [Gammaproteobacteria bacterium]